jgi:pyridoxamine 5'-phosphate oxidase
MITSTHGDVDVGAGAGFYEPADRYVTAVEPAAAMRAQRPTGAAPAIDATAESLPIEQARQRVADNPGLIVPEWTLHTLPATQVEIWQGDKQRRHTRLRYARTDAGWGREILWP